METPAEKAAREAREFEKWQAELIPPKPEKPELEETPQQKDLKREVNDYQAGKIDTINP